MSKKSKAKLEKKKRRERRVRHERNVRRGILADGDAFDEPFDLAAALEDLPLEFQFERIQRRVVRASGRRLFADRQEVLAELESLGPPGSERAKALSAADPREEAQDLAFLAFDPANAEHADQLVELALELDPECVDAATLKLAFEDSGSASTISALEAQIARAEDALGADHIEAHRSRLWDDVMARPYLRARRLLANLLLARGRRAEAEEHYTELLAIAPDDPLQIRDAVLGLALERGDLESARELLARSRESGSPVADWAAALVRFLEGDQVTASGLVAEARGQNEFVELELLAPGSTEGELCTDLASESRPFRDRLIEAELVEVRIGSAWRAHPAALAWLADGARASTREEREAVCASFSSPVSALLAAGDEGLGGDWIDYPATHGLRPADVPELLRMASETAMLELDEDDPRAAAPRHAWRALGTLAAAEAVEPLLALAIRSPEEERLLLDLPVVMARIGEPALSPLRAVFEDAERGFHARLLAGEALAKVGASDPRRRERALAVFAAELERCDRNDADFNGWLVGDLLELRATELAPAIRSAFERDLVDPMIAGDWGAVAEELGVG